MQAEIALLASQLPPNASYQTELVHNWCCVGRGKFLRETEEGWHKVPSSFFNASALCANLVTA